MPVRPLFPRLAVFVAGLVLLTCPLFVAAQAAGTKADARSAAELMPPSVLFYAEVQRPRELLNFILDHPLRAQVERSSDFKNALESPQFKEFRQVVEALEQRTGVEWRPALEKMTGGGIALGFDAPTQGLIILVKSEDPKVTESVRDSLIEMVRQDAAGKGQKDPVEQKDYRGLKAFKTADSTMVEMGSWLLVSNKPNAAKAVADAYVDGKSESSLAKTPEYEGARELVANGVAGKPTAWAFVKMAPLRLFAADKPVFDKSHKSDDAAVELFFGGLIPPLRNAPYIAGTLTLDDSHNLKIAVTAPHEPSTVGEERKFFFAQSAGEGGGADQPLKPRGTLLTVTTYRDLAGWWASSPDLLTEGAAAKMAQADSGLSTFLGGKSFGTDVLGALRPQIQLVVAAQEYEQAGVPAPQIKLPAGAIVFRLKAKEAQSVALRKHFRVGFQSIVALANLDGASKGRPLLEMNTDRRGKAEILSASYAPPEEVPAEGVEADGKKAEKSEKAEKSPDADIHYNFSPAVVLSPDYLILCSTRQLANDLADLAAKQGAGADAGKPIPQNTLIEVTAGPVGELLRANREQLIAQNILEKGHSREAAEKEVDLLVTLVNAVSGAKVSLTPTDKQITLEIELQSAK